jgi:hypothetical protein
MRCTQPTTLPGMSTGAIAHSLRVEIKPLDKCTELFNTSFFKSIELEIIRALFSKCKCLCLSFPFFSGRYQTRLALVSSLEAWLIYW